MEEILQTISDKLEEILQVISDKLSDYFEVPSFSDLFDKVKSGFSWLFGLLYNFLFVENQDIIFSVGNNFFGLVYNSITYGNFIAFVVGISLVIALFKFVVHIVRG